MHGSWGEYCHAEYNEASRPVRKILRFAQDDKRESRSGLCALGSVHRHLFPRYP